MPGSSRPCLGTARRCDSFLSSSGDRCGSTIPTSTWRITCDTRPLRVPGAIANYATLLVASCRSSSTGTSPCGRCGWSRVSSAAIGLSSRRCTIAWSMASRAPTCSRWCSMPSVSPHPRCPTRGDPRRNPGTRDSSWTRSPTWWPAHTSSCERRGPRCGRRGKCSVSSVSSAEDCARLPASFGRRPCRRSMVRSARTDVGTGRARRSQT